MHAVITGASSGIGEAIAARFARAGWKLTLAARRADRLEQLAATLTRAHGVEVFVRPSDLSVLDQCGALIADAEEALGPVGVLVNNAGIQYVEPAVSVSHERSERLFTVDLLAPIRLTREVLPGMIQRGRGAIVNIASMAGVTPTPGMMHYSAAKAALGAASESLRHELRHTGVHVVAVYPGPVHSDMEAAAREQLQENLAARLSPTGRADELADEIYRAIIRHHNRVIYPRSYGAAWYTRVFSQWVTNTFTPPLRISQREAVRRLRDT